MPDEMSLCRYWNGARLPSGWRTTDGRGVEVIYRGQWSHGYGPDFRGAILSLGGGGAVRGDVEVHVCASAWRRHGHPSNPMYDQVALHVVWEADVAIATAAPVLELSRYVALADLEGMPPPGRLDDGPCSVFGSPATAARALAVIEAAGDARFEARAVALEGELACASPEQVLYAGLMECMGYSENKLPFRLLAERLPYESARGSDAAEVRDRLRAASGLLPDAPGLLEKKQWNVARLRPANHPLRRMAGLAEVITRAEQGGGLVTHLIEEGVGLGGDGLLARLQAPAEQGQALIGPDRAVEGAINVVLPFAVALGRLREEPDLEHAAAELWRALPRGSATRVERAMRDHLEVPSGSRLLRGARHQQGLLHLYKRYCAQRLCAACPLSQLQEAPSP